MSSNYIYKALEQTNYYDVTCFQNVNICCYNVNYCYDKPFLCYLLEKDNNLEYSFPILENNDKLYENVCNYFNINLNETIIYKNKEIFNGKLFIFYELVSQKNMYQNKNFEKVIIYEILNIKKIKKSIISSFVINFFLENSFFCYLFDDNNDVLEIPIIAFNYVQRNKINYTIYNEILYDPDFDFYKLNLDYKINTDLDYSTLRYVVFIKYFITFTTIENKDIIDNLHSHDSVISSTKKLIFFKNKSQQMIML